MTEKAMKEELRGYSERYYAKPLEEAGFLSYRNDLLNWYRISNGVICHFHILSAHSRLPMTLFLWWIHPTYVATILNPPVSWTNHDGTMKLYEHRIAFQAHIVEPGGGINIPNLPQRGAERLFDEFFPQIEPLQSREAVYQFWKNDILKRAKRPQVELSNITSPDFADQVLVMQDSEMFAPCIDYIEAILPRANHKYIQASPFSRSPELLKAQLKALQGEDVDQYFVMLKERKDKFLKRYKLQDEAFEL